MSAAVEIRSIGGVQAQGRKVTGYAAVFNADADLGEFVERIQPGAFSCKTACKTFQISGVISVQKLPPWVV